ncbi:MULTISPECIES: protein-tyrosine phosphatase family protein [unclassified Ruegeria]|uniref:phosphatase domain-containing protein n=1 Tax=unclassified Ruegeria TaxID=2625375 RepID=UPI001487A185|nr:MULTISPECIES: protein-tyrosine phosphatase family protein [unclassified Ruegeria]
MSGFQIYSLTVGDGQLALCPLPGRDGNYEADLCAIAAWAPDLVITLTTAEELAQLGASALGRDVENIGAKWVHFPIADFGTPEDDAQSTWEDVRALGLCQLSGGGRVLVHCRGGCGRSGMVVLRLMIDSGEAPVEALARLRKTRVCAVETQGQMDWAMGRQG